jgi:hypothetical protein
VSPARALASRWGVRLPRRRAIRSSRRKSSRRAGSRTPGPARVRESGSSSSRRPTIPIPASMARRVPARGSSCRSRRIGISSPAPSTGSRRRGPGGRRTSRRESASPSRCWRGSRARRPQPAPGSSASSFLGYCAPTYPSAVPSIRPPRTSTPRRARPGRRGRSGSDGGFAFGRGGKAIGSLEDISGWRAGAPCGWPIRARPALTWPGHRRRDPERCHEPPAGIPVRARGRWWIRRFPSGTGHRFACARGGWDGRATIRVLERRGLMRKPEVPAHVRA